MPVIALIGKPNVGKSTLFNRLSKTKDALVANVAGLTRDRKYTTINLSDNLSIDLIDTGGLSFGKSVLEDEIKSQISQALSEADLIFFITSTRDGITKIDTQIANYLHRQNTQVLVIDNKSENSNNSYECLQLGFGEALPISAEHGLGITELKQKATTFFKQQGSLTTNQNKTDNSVKLALVGRPNVGKSTLVNRLLGQKRVLTLDLPGTTRDSIYIPFSRGKQNYTLIDTAGIVRKRRTKEKITAFSIVKTIEAITKCDIVLMMLDAKDGITTQDSHIFGLIEQKAKAVIPVVNKWDAVDNYQKQQLKRLLEVKLRFIANAKIHYLSALKGSGITPLYPRINQIYQALEQKFATSYLNTILAKATQNHQAPLVNRQRLRLKFINQSGNNPFVFTIFGNKLNKIPNSYRRYLINFFQTNLQLNNIPIIFRFKNSDNPFKK